MKIFISADMEGVTGISRWEDVRVGSDTYQRSTDRMSQELLAACEGASEAGAEEILIRDGHGSARNIDPMIFPANVTIFEGWGGHPYSMLEGIDNTFNAVFYLGYHSPAGTDANPLAHTISSKKIHQIKVNNLLASEFYLNQLIALSEGVPSAFLSGDQGICNEARRIYPEIVTVAAMEGSGYASRIFSAEKTLTSIQTGARKAVEQLAHIHLPALPDRFEVDVEYLYHFDAYNASFYPGVQKVSAKSVHFESQTVLDLMTTLKFII